MIMKKGFTLIETVVIIAILGVIIAITATAMTNSAKTTKQAACRTKIKMIEKAAIMYVQDNPNMYGNYSVKISVLLNNDYLDDDENNAVINPLTNESMNDCNIALVESNGKITVNSIDDNDHTGVCKCE